MNIYIIVALIIAIIYCYRWKQETFEVLCKLKEDSPVPMKLGYPLNSDNSIKTTPKGTPINNSVLPASLLTFKTLNRYPWQMA